MDPRDKSDNLLKALYNFPSCKNKIRKDIHSCENDYFICNVHCKCNSFVVLKLRKHCKRALPAQRANHILGCA